MASLQLPVPRNATIGAETVVNIIDNKTHNGMSVKVKIVPDYLVIGFNQSPYTAMYAFLIRNSQEAYFLRLMQKFFQELRIIRARIRTKKK